MPKIHVEAFMRRGLLDFCAYAVVMTFRAYRDREASSPDGRFRFVARSPQNEADHPDRRDGHQRHFRYELQAPDGVRWMHAQADGEGSPVQALVSDDGFVVVRAHDGQWGEEQLLCFDRAGRKALVVLVRPPGHSELDEQLRTLVSDGAAVSV